MKQRISRSLLSDSKAMLASALQNVRTKGRWPEGKAIFDLRSRLLMTLVALMAMTAGAWADKKVFFPEGSIVYDFEAAANAGENPDNKNGSAANGQQFYGWENGDDRKDKAQQDYKGYEYAEGSKLPEVCHVWRRSDRINGNVAGNGGLKCPSNKEMAIDGLVAGDKVVIVYDATNATEKNIIWAIGDGTSDGGPGTVRAKATINGVEAVTGQTPIPSGALIQVNKVTPATNGSGYIVFKVKKDMVIKQIVIIPASAGPIVTATANANEWEFTMPAGAVELEIAYKTVSQLEVTFGGEAIDLAKGVKGFLGFEEEFASELAATVADLQSAMFTYESSDPTVMAFGENNEASGALADIKFLQQGSATLKVKFDGNDDYGKAEMVIPVTVTEKTYIVTVDDGGEDTEKWTIEPADATNPEKGVKAGTEIKATYSGTRHVKSVKAVVEGAIEYNEASWDDSGAKVVLTKKTTASEPTAVADAETDVTWSDGWYTVSGNVTITGNVTLGEDTHLILQDCAKLTINGQINCNSGSGYSLYIYGQEAGDGKLNVSNSSRAINGSNSSGKTIEIHGGEITATSTSGTGFYCRGIKMYGGKLTATSESIPGIGYGSGNFDVYGGEVEATSNGDLAACGIVSNSGTSILTVYGGTMKATGGTGDHSKAIAAKIKSGTPGITFYFADSESALGDAAGTAYSTETDAPANRYAKAE